MYVLGCKNLTVGQNWFGACSLFFLSCKTYRKVYNDVAKDGENVGILDKSQNARAKKFSGTFFQALGFFKPSRYMPAKMRISQKWVE